MARKVGLDEVEEDDLESLLESIGEELTMEDIEDLEKQRRQLEEVEAGQQPMVPQTKGDDHRDSPGVPRPSPPDHGLHGKYRPGFRKVWTKEVAGDGDYGLLRGPAV